MRHADRVGLFFPALPCDSFPSANIIPRSTAPAHGDPILVLQAAFRVERVRERERQERFEAAHCTFTARNASCMSTPAAALRQDMVSRNMKDEGAAPRLLSHCLVFVLLPVCQLTFH